MASHSTPLCSAKPASSLAMTARFRCGLMCGIGHPLLAPLDALLLAQQAPGLAALEAGGLRIDDVHRRDAQRKAPLQRQQRSAPAAPSRRNAWRFMRLRACESSCSRRRGEHRPRIGHHAAPDQEGLGRLLDQHAQAVARRGAQPRRPVGESVARRCRTSGPPPACPACSTASLHGHFGAAQAAGAAVQHHVVGGAGAVQPAAGQGHAVRVGPRGVAPRQRGGLVGASVRYMQPTPAAPRSTGRARPPRRRRRRSAAGADPGAGVPR